ncbi:MAG: hypothetical protein ABS939_00170 [Psychrobacillus sp.]
MQEITIFDLGVTEPKKEKVEVSAPPTLKETVSKKKAEGVKAAKAKAETVKEEIKVTGEWTIHFATETFQVADFVEEIPEEGITLEQVREGLERSFAQFSVARTKWDVDKENNRLFPDAFAGSKGGDSSMRVPFFTSIEDAVNHEGTLSYVIGANGQVYESRKSLWGDLLVKTNRVERVKEVEEQFNFHLPKIPSQILAHILSFFEAYTKKGEYEVMLCVYWDKETETYFLDCPKQVVTKFHIDKQLNPAYGGRNSLRYIKVLEIHSHNTMRAYFSGTDDADEQQFGLYGVVGRLDKPGIEIVTRVKVNDNAFLIPFTDIFERDLSCATFDYPKEWEANVQLKGEI